MKYEDLSPKEKAEIDALRADVAAERAAAAARQAERDGRLSASPDVPANVNSFPAIRDEVARINDKLNAILDELRGD